MVYELVRRMEEHYQGIQVREINLVEHPEVAVKYGVMATPALVINGRLEFTGVPKEKKLKERLEALLVAE